MTVTATAQRPAPASAQSSAPQSFWSWLNYVADHWGSAQMGQMPALAPPLQKRWFADNLRVVRPGGIVMLSVHGESYRRRLSAAELREYDAKGVVIRAGVGEGGPWYTTYQTPQQVEHELLAGQEIVYRVNFTDPARPLQDTWVVRKRAA